MTCSPAQLAANRANAQKSTGPKTEEGKRRSRANALKHGLCASAVVPESLELIQERASEWFYALKPQNEYQSWLVDKITVLSLRVDRVERMERRLRDRRSLRAELAWDEDRKVEVEALGGPARGPALGGRRGPPADHRRVRLADRPLGDARAGRRRRRHLDRRAGPARLRPPGHPAEFRDGRPAPATSTPSPTTPRPPPSPPGSLARLRSHREAVAEPRRGRPDARRGRPPGRAHPELKRLRRQESALHSRLRWCLAEMRHGRCPTSPTPS